MAISNKTKRRQIVYLSAWFAVNFTVVHKWHIAQFRINFENPHIKITVSFLFCDSHNFYPGI